MIKFKIVKILMLLVFLVFYQSAVHATSINELKEMLGYNIATSSYIEVAKEEVEKAFANDLIKEMRPFLKDIISSNVSSEHDFSTQEIINIVGGHPIKFLSALYNYVVYNIKEVFSIAEQGATIDVSVEGIE